MKKTKIIIFDLDGVLIDSLKNMKFALNKTSIKLSLELNFEIYRKYLGLPFEEIMKKMKIKKGEKIIKKNYEYFSELNLKKIKIKQSFIKELKKLKKEHILTVFTSKNKKRTLKILNKYKLFDYIVTADDVKKGKPDPEGVFKILSKFKVSCMDCLYIGDSLYDLDAANSAKVKYLHASWGYEDLTKVKKIKKIYNLKDIGKHFLRSII